MTATINQNTAQAQKAENTSQKAAIDIAIDWSTSGSDKFFLTKKTYCCKFYLPFFTVSL